ncbi:MULTISPECIES: hypothetical protein [unclassified Moorena]|uniref:hypothetical protein n=1 Tax=unclassified Moorena TaxID=2683338 RepID=UPI0014010615|nr:MULTISPECIES: hypothetical protein [unclassified Moorena]NEO13035.1 hypothetical protein [Moorena sp. SIO3E8]NEQ00250.1 hypothetical protein [Moorena sp. SIO3F7]
MQSLMGETPKTALHRFLRTPKNHPNSFLLLPAPYSLLPFPITPMFTNQIKRVELALKLLN